MGEGDETKTRDEVEILEKGEIFFFYRPKVNLHEAHSSDDVQRMYILLRPESSPTSIQQKQATTFQNEDANNGTQSHSGNQEVNIEKETLLRLMVMGRKKMPEIGKRSQPFWGYVEMVTTGTEEVKSALAGKEYDTATRGRRQKPQARALGEGIYRILLHKPGRVAHTHMVYKLELPEEVKEEGGGPQEEMNVEREGSYIIQIKNPEEGGRSGGGGGYGGFSGRQMGKRKTGVFPAQLQGILGRRRFAQAEPTDFLNYEGCEFLLISASDDVEEELGLELKTEVVDGGSPEECSDLVKTFGETASTAALFKSRWV